MDVIDDKMENKLKSQKTDGSDGEIGEKFNFSYNF